MRRGASHISAATPATAPIRPDRETATSSPAIMKNTAAASHSAVASSVDSIASRPPSVRCRDWTRAIA
jgi:hypothetical protein